MFSTRLRKEVETTHRQTGASRDSRPFKQPLAMLAPAIRHILQDDMRPLLLKPGTGPVDGYRDAGHCSKKA